jgi:hypothetical protein
LDDVSIETPRYVALFNQRDWDSLRGDDPAR